MRFFFYAELACAVVLAGCLFSFLLLARKLGGRSQDYKMPPYAAPEARLAVIIPARNESLVIEQNLRSLHACVYPKELFDIYVIVESMEDPTVEIACKYPNTKIFLRKDLSKQGKGYALNECICDIFAQKKQYDAFLFFDADNLVEKNFLSRINDAVVAGYDAGCGKRDNKDWNASTVCAASALTFTVINSVQNKQRAARGMNVVVSGTGFFVRYGVLEKLGGWPFSTLTEDYEFSTYATYNNLKTTYIEDAVFYDEQPLRLWPSIKQRSRWVRGYFSVRAKYHQQKKQFGRTASENKDVKASKLGTVPTFVAIFDLIFYFFLCVAAGVAATVTGLASAAPYWLRAGGVLLLLYLAIVFFTLWLFCAEGEAIQMKRGMKLKAILYHPVFLATYVVAAVRALWLKDRWEVIEHSLNVEAPE